MKCTVNNHYNVTGQMHEPDEVMPEFYAPLENWTVTQGRDIYFTCTVNNLGNYKVINIRSIRSNNKIILSFSNDRLLTHGYSLSLGFTDLISVSEIIIYPFPPDIIINSRTIKSIYINILKKPIVAYRWFSLKSLQRKLVYR